MSTPTPLLSWHSDPKLKAEVVAQMRAHRDADEIIRATYQKLDPSAPSGYRGCLIGCTLPAQPPRYPGTRNWEMVQDPNGGWHARVEKLYGIPATIGHLFDNLFEDMPTGDHAQFAVDSIEAVPVGVDLSQVADRWALDMLTDTVHGWAITNNERERTDIAAAAALYQLRLAGAEPADEAWAQLHRDASGNSVAQYAVDAGRWAVIDKPSAYIWLIPDDWEDTAWSADRLLHHLVHAALPHRIATAVKAGHQLEWDAPGGITSARRWTCANRECGAAVLAVGANVYGSATERTCAEEQARWAETRNTLGGGAR